MAAGDESRSVFETEGAPKPLLLEQEDQIVSSNVHPTQDILAVGDIAGKLTVYSFRAGESCSEVCSITPQTGHSCRILRFSTGGKWLYSGSSQKGVFYWTDIETQTVVQTLEAHSDPLYSILPVSDKLLATGSEGGEIKLWDVRERKQACCVKENHDFISAMAVDGNTLLATSGDGSLTAMDLRHRKIIQRSDCNESELLSLAIVKSGSKVVCGDGEGVLMIYNWGLWNDITDRYPIHSDGVDCMLALNSDVVCTGCMDGWVRSIQILPNTFLGSVGQHDSGFPVENMCLSHDRKYLVTSSPFSCQFWPVNEIPTLPLLEDEGEEQEGVARKKRRKRKQKHRDLATEEHTKTKKLQQADFFSDLCS